MVHLFSFFNSNKSKFDFMFSEVNVLLGGKNIQKVLFFQTNQ